MKQVKYVGIDGWNRPVFKALDSKDFYGSVHELFSYEASESEVLEKVKESDLCWFGSSFGCEPMGTPADVTILR